MADMFLDPIMEKIISAGFRYLKDQVRWQTGMKKELVKLQQNLPKIQAVVHFASSQEQITDQNPALNKWLWQLRDAIDDADDVFDELEYIELEKRVTKNKKPRSDEKKLTKNKMLRRVRSIMKSMKKRLVKIVKRALKIDPTLKRLDEALQKLYGVSSNVDSFFNLVKDAKQDHLGQQLELYRARETGSLPKSALNVRDKETKLVLEWLRNPSNEPQRTDLFYKNISLLSIVGHGGMGKTTLLQHVYSDVNKDEDITKEFDHKMWVCVSNNFDVKKVIGDMLECLKKEKPRVEALHSLQDSLRTEVKSKKFLLVLDDVWDEEEGRDQSKWEDVFPSLASGAFGSKVLVTTRTDSVALMFARIISKKKEIVKLEGLEEDACLQLLNFHALAGVADDDHKKLRAIGGEIAKKLLGSPLATKVIGLFLNEKLDEVHWRSVLESNLLNQNSINSILRLSYIVLPHHLRNCFAFCCVFPQDYEYDKDDVVRMWIALGFIQPSQEGMTMEDIGERYFDVLVKKALIDKVEDDYKMHDLIHESASTFFALECGKVVDDHENSSVETFDTIRHLFVVITNLNIFKKIGQYKHLHSLFLFDQETSNQDLCNGLIEIFKSSRSLRLLYINAPNLKMIPEDIGNLIHLRYLKIDDYSMTILPRFLSNLYHLQYIISKRPGQIRGDDFLPRDFNNLSNLCYMKLSQNCISSICGIGKLKALQELKIFAIRDESGYRIGELENMNDLACKLRIKYLENVKDAEEARHAQLHEKRRLTNLTLQWTNIDSSGNNNLEENVLENLQPPKCLRKLSIKRYMGARSATWMNNINLIINLEKIKLIDCLEWETLPPFGQLPFLKSLKLGNMPKVKWLESKFNGKDKNRYFPFLEELSIINLEALEDWSEAGVAAEDGCYFPRLIQLLLFNCPKLKELPSLPSKLKRLEIHEIGWKALNFCSNSNPIPLETLYVCDCPNITWINNINLIINLEKIKLIDCLEWETLPPFGQLPFLKSLKLVNMPKVKWLESKFNGNDKNRSFPFLEELSIINLKALEDWSEAGVAAEDGCLFPCLIYLNLYGCPKLKELPSLPSKLNSLDIYNIGWRTLNFYSNSSPILLETLSVDYCPNITCLPLADEIARLAALRELTIKNCPNLISLGEKPTTNNNCQHLMLSDLSISDPAVLLMEPLRSIASLKRLTISGNDEVFSFPNEAEQWFLNLSSSLSELNFSWLESLQSLPSSLERLSSLQTLFLYHVPMLQGLPNLPPSLKSLKINICHPELEKRCRKDGGSDWHKIAHIPHISIIT